MKTFNFIFLPLMAVTFFTEISAHAALGAPAASITTDKKILKLSDGNARSSAQFRFEEMVSNEPLHKVKVRQFITSAGNIFAVAWSGPIGDQLPQLLGKYAADFAQRETQHPARKGRIPYRKVVAGPVVLEFWNELHYQVGRAYVPTEMPQGVTLNDIKLKD